MLAAFVDFILALFDDNATLLVLMFCPADAR